MQFSNWLTTLGQAEILVPLTFTLALWLLASRQPESGWRWIAGLRLAGLLTLASKIAFIGWGIGSAEFDFTGFSGHAMLSAASYPLLFRMLFTAGVSTGAGMPGIKANSWLGVGTGYAIAAGIAVSRVVVGAHSPAESLAGFALGAAVSASVLWRPWQNSISISRPAQATVLLYLLILPGLAPQSHSHRWITALTLQLADHARPFTRADLHREPSKQSPAAGYN